MSWKIDLPKHGLREESLDDDRCPVNLTLQSSGGLDAFSNY
jgi:hypothetical protein